MAKESGLTLLGALMVASAGVHFVLYGGNENRCSRLASDGVMPTAPLWYTVEPAAAPAPGGAPPAAPRPRVALATLRPSCDLLPVGAFMTESTKGGPLRIARNGNYVKLNAKTSRLHTVKLRNIRSSSYASYSQRTPCGIVCMQV